MTKYQHGPAFFNVMVGIIINLDTWNGLEEAQRACLIDQAKWLEEQWPAWKVERDQAEADKITAAGIEYVDLGADFAQGAYDVYWRFLGEQSPEIVPQLRALVER